MMTPDDIRQGIQQAAERRKQAERERREATEDLRAWLLRARETNISHSEAAQLAGLSRNGAYDLLGRH